jgi:hypothetical protein
VKAMLASNVYVVHRTADENPFETPAEQVTGGEGDKGTKQGAGRKAAAAQSGAVVPPAQRHCSVRHDHTQHNAGRHRDGVAHACHAEGPALVVLRQEAPGLKKSDLEALLPGEDDVELGPGGGSEKGGWDEGLPPAGRDKAGEQRPGHGVGGAQRPRPACCLAWRLPPHGGFAGLCCHQMAGSGRGTAMAACTRQCPSPAGARTP